MQNNQKCTIKVFFFTFFYVIKELTFICFIGCFALKIVAHTHEMFGLCDKK